MKPEVIIFTETPSKEYFRALQELADQNKINLEMRDSRCFYLLALKVYSSLSFLRRFMHKYFHKPLEVEQKINWKDIRKSFTAYFSLPFTKKTIVAFFAPFSWQGKYLWFLKECNRKVVYMSSWPYWDGKKSVYKLNSVKRVFWSNFLKGTPAVGISASTVKGLQDWHAKAVQIPHAVDTSYFIPGKQEKNKVLIIGRLIPEKGIEEILSVAKELPEIEFVFAGSGMLESRVKECNIPNVKYLGKVKGQTLVELYQSGTLLVSNSFRTSSWEELFGIVLIEAFACGIPVIATDCVGPKEIVAEGGGMLIAQHSPSQLKETIELLCADALLLRSYAREARRIAQEKYDVNILAEKWMKVLE